MERGDPGGYVTGVSWGDIFRGDIGTGGYPGFFSYNRLYVCIYIVCIYEYMHALHVCMDICKMHVCVYVYMYAYVCMYIYIYIYMFMYRE